MKKKEDVYVVVDTPKKAKKLKRVLDMFKEDYFKGVGCILEWTKDYKCVYLSRDEMKWHGVTEICLIEGCFEKVSIKELRNILAKEHLKAGDVVALGYGKSVGYIGVFKAFNNGYFEVDCYLSLNSGSGMLMNGPGYIKNFIRYATEEEKALLEPKKELEIGKWYRYNNCIINYQGVKDGLLQAYGLLNSGEWADTSNFGETPNEWVESTEDEVKSVLVEEAKRRYRVRSVVKCLDDVELEVNGADFLFCNNCLFSNGERVNGGNWFNTSGKLFEHGKWATVIEQDNFTDSDVAIVERLHDTLLDNHGYSLDSKLLTDARILANKLKNK